MSSSSFLSNAVPSLEDCDTTKLHIQDLKTYMLQNPNLSYSYEENGEIIGLDKENNNQQKHSISVIPLEESEYKKSFTWFDIDAFPEHLNFQDFSLFVEKIFQEYNTPEFLSKFLEKTLMFAKRNNLKIPASVQKLSLQPFEHKEFFKVCSESHTDFLSAKHAFNVLKTMRIYADIERIYPKNLEETLKHQTMMYLQSFSSKILFQAGDVECLETGNIMVHNIRLKNNPLAKITLSSRVKDEDILILKSFAYPNKTIQSIHDLIGFRFIVDNEETQLELAHVLTQEFLHLTGIIEGKGVEIDHLTNESFTTKKNTNVYTNNLYKAIHINTQHKHILNESPTEIQIITEKESKHNTLNHHAFYKAKQLFLAVNRMDALTENYTHRCIEEAYTSYLMDYPYDTPLLLDSLSPATKKLLLSSIKIGSISEDMKEDISQSFQDIQQKKSILPWITSAWNQGYIRQSHVISSIVNELFETHFLLPANNFYHCKEQVTRLPKHLLSTSQKLCLHALALFSQKDIEKNKDIIQSTIQDIVQNTLSTENDHLLKN